LAALRAFSFFKGACTRGIYDNMKTAVETIFVGKERKFNRRFAQMCSHYLVEPVACTPRSNLRRPRKLVCVGLGERPGREPSWYGAGAVLHAAPAVQKL
jgi:hypothetical protein